MFTASYVSFPELLQVRSPIKFDDLLKLGSTFTVAHPLRYLTLLCASSIYYIYFVVSHCLGVSSCLLNFTDRYIHIHRRLCNIKYNYKY